MPKVRTVKAAKDYPNLGIAKGDMCYVWKVRTSNAGGREFRSKTYPRPSQLNFGFTGQLGDIEQDMENAEDLEALRGFAETLRELGEEQQEKFNNMPEGLQQGDTGQLLEERANGLSEWADAIEEACDEAQSKIDEIDAKEPQDLDDINWDPEDPDDTPPDEEQIEEAREAERQAAFEEAKEAATSGNPL